MCTECVCVHGSGWGSGKVRSISDGVLTVLSKTVRVTAATFSLSTAPSLDSSTYYTLYTRININKKETDPLRINAFAIFFFPVKGYPADI